MSRYLYIKITGGTSPGPYTIYYNDVLSGNEAFLYPSGNLATGLTLTQLQVIPGLEVSTPNIATSILIYNQKCDTYETFDIGEAPPEQHCVCVTLTNVITGVNGQLLFCPNGFYINNKPIYTLSSGGQNYAITWNQSNQYWECSDLPGYPGFTIRCTDPDSVPLSPWVLYGVGSQDYIINATIDVCQNPLTIYNISCTSQEPTCVDVNDGVIISTATGGAGGWKYSLDNILFFNTTGIFSNLAAGTYTVYAKDISGNTTSCSLTLDSRVPAEYPLPINLLSNDFLCSDGNMTFYVAYYEIDTTSLADGVTATFDFNLNYGLSYLSPGSAIFYTDDHSIVINNSSQTITSTDCGDLLETGPSSCSPSYSQYDGYNNYSATGLSVTNIDIVTGYTIYGIDTQTLGQWVPPCYTKATVTINMTLTNVTLDNVCDTVSPSNVSFSLTQTYSP
jgi:hypothetical protein